MLHYLLRSKPLQIKILVGVLGLLVFAIDMVVPADLDVAIFYCFVIVLCAWTRSRAFLWIVASIFLVATIPGLILSPPAATGPISWVDWANRLFGIGALLSVAVFVDLRMRHFSEVEATMRAKEMAERELRQTALRLQLAQVAGKLGSWEWDASDDLYQCSEECYEVLGISNRDAWLFASQWMSHLHPADLGALRSAMHAGTERGEFELDYRYEHPSKGPRWIHTRAKMFERFSAGRRLFGIHQDVTERKQVEALLQQSQTTLESLVQQRTTALRKLSTALLQSQDEERRRIARELHDSFGQYLASLKINLDVLSGVSSTGALEQERRAEILSECLKIVQECITETRTLSYLLHPALLDEAGFVAAARWDVEGFAKRSGIKVQLDLSPDFTQLPTNAELALFRTLQECLTNVHRYSGSPSVDVIFESDAEEAVLLVRDYGQGVPSEVAKSFREHGTGVGVGLSGMRERMAELGGRLEIFSDDRGTAIRASIPLDTHQDTSTKVA